MAAFDPYHKWLGIAPNEQPPNHYRLLGIRTFEDDPDVISAAADRQMAFIRQHANGPQAGESQKLLNELANARLCLLTETRRRNYDARLRSDLGSTAGRNTRAALAGLSPAVLVAIAAAVCLVVIVGTVALWPRKPSQPTLAKQTKSTAVHQTTSHDKSPSLPRSSQPNKDVKRAATAEQEAETNAIASAAPALPSADPIPNVEPTGDVPSQPDSLAPPASPISVSAPTAVAGSSKLAAPEQDELRRAVNEIRDILKDEYTKAKNPDGKVSLALVLLDHGRKSAGDSVSKYALLTEARDSAAAAGNAELVVKAIDELDQEFEIEAIAMKATSLSEASRHLKDADDRPAFVEATLGAADQAVDADDFENAQKLLASAQSIATKGRDAELRKRVSARLTELKKLEKDSESLAAARKVLDTSPDDPAANSRVGKHLCFYREDWEEGLPMLAKGEDSKLSDLAQRELESPTDVEDQAKLADDWWSVGVTQPAGARERVQQHAGQWYSRSVSTLAGAAKGCAEKRLAQLEGEKRPSNSKRKQPPGVVAIPDPNGAPVARPLDVDFERKFAQRLIDKNVQSLSLKGENQGVGGNLKTLPEWPFYIEAIELRAPQTLSDEDLIDAQRLHGINNLVVDGDALSERGFARFAKTGTLRRVVVRDTKITGAIFRSCPNLEQVEFLGVMDTASLEAMALNSPRLNFLRIRGLQSTPADFAAISRMQNLARIELEDCKFNAEAIESLSRLPRLAWIDFTRAEFTGRPPRIAPPFPVLTSLGFRNSVVPKGVVSWFATSFPQLRRFHTDESTVEEDNWREMRRMTGLHTLEGYKSFSDEALQYLPTSLAEINLRSSNITGSGFQKLRGEFPNLIYLNLESTQVTDDNLIHILKLAPKLRTLSIPHTKVGSAGFKQIARLPEIGVLAMHGVVEPVQCLQELEKGAPKLGMIYCQFPPDVIAAFQRTHPNCKIQW
jgi:cytoskeletal protein RodZ